MARVIKILQHGGPEVLTLQDSDVAAPSAGQVQVRTRAIGVNYIDVYFRTGLYSAPLPFRPGVEAAGVVERVGAGVARLAIGDRVAWAGAPGAYAELVNVPTERLIPIPEGVSDEIAAASMLQGMTAHFLTHAVRSTQIGDTAVVLAAAGGVGLLLVQMLVRAGASVIAVCSTPEKQRLAKQAGAQQVIGYDDPPFDQQVRQITEGRGADVVYDSVGRTTFDASLGSLRARGLLALYGQSSGPVPPFDPSRLNTGGSLFLTRPSLAHYTATRQELELRAGSVLTAIADAELDVRIGARFALEATADAHRALEGRTTTGKVLLLP